MYCIAAKDAEISPVETEGAKDVSIQWLIDESRGGPNFAMRRFVVEPGGCTPTHQHAWEHEVYILRGIGEVVLADETVNVAADTAVLIEPDELHQFRNTGVEPLEFLCLVPNGPATEGAPK